MVLAGVNTLAAPKRAKCSGGLLALFTVIRTPETVAASEMRRKWITQEYAKDALFDSLFPDLKQYTMDRDGGNDFWILLLLLVLTVVLLIAFAVIYYKVVPAYGHVM